MPVLSWLLCAERSRDCALNTPRHSSTRPLSGPGVGPRPVQFQALRPAIDTRTVPHRSHDSFPMKPVRPSPQSQSFSQSYRSILPTSLTYMLLVDERLFTLETCCGYGYDPARKSHSPSEFQGPTRAHRTPQEPRCSTDTPSPYRRMIRFQGA